MLTEKKKKICKVVPLLVKEVGNHKVDSMSMTGFTLISKGTARAREIPEI